MLNASVTQISALAAHFRWPPSQNEKIAILIRTATATPRTKAQTATAATQSAANIAILAETVAVMIAIKRVKSTDAEAEAEAKTEAESEAAVRRPAAENRQPGTARIVREVMAAEEMFETCEISMAAAKRRNQAATMMC